MRICVVGDGISALASAFYAARAGFEVVIAPIHRDIPWLERSFEHDGQRFDCFHQPIHSTDAALCGFLAEMELLPRLVWKDVSCRVFAADEKRYLTSSAMLRECDGLSAIGRWRTSYALRRLLSYSPLSCDLTWSEWLAQSCGVEASRALAEPLSSAVCGETIHSLSARSAQLLVRTLVHKATRRQASFVGGLSSLLATIRGKLQTRGVEWRPAGAISGIQRGASGEVRVRFGEKTELFDAVIATDAPTDWIKLIDVSEERELPALGASPEGMISAVALVRGRRLLSHGSIVAFSQYGYPFAWVHAPEPLRNERSPDLWPVYLTHRGPSHLPTFLADDETWADRARRTLAEMVVPVAHDAVEQVHVFRTRNIDCSLAGAEPAKALPVRLGRLPVFLGTTARSPMRPLGPESSVMVAREAVDAAVQNATRFPTPVTQAASEPLSPQRRRARARRPLELETSVLRPV